MTENLLPWIEFNNLTVLAISKPSHFSESSEEMEQEMMRLKQVDARIIITLSDSPVALSCWMHRFGMFGPEFVIIGNVWSEFEPDIPEYISEWCTSETLSQVIENWIFIGQGSNVDLFGNSFNDSTGLTVEDFLHRLDSLVVDGSSHPDSDWAPKCYDIALLMGYVIGEAEKSIRTKLNSTIETLAADPRQSSLLLSAIEEALFNVQVTGQKGVYNFERKTKGNTGGYVPVIFYQRIYDSSKSNLERRAVGYMATFEESVNDLNGGFVFRTKNGQPPRGYAKVVTYQRKIVQPVEYWVYISISILLITLIILLNIANRVSNPRQWKDNALPSMGIIVILCHIFANPINNHFTNFAVHCSAILLIDSFGFSIFWLGLYRK